MLEKTTGKVITACENTSSDDTNELQKEILNAVEKWCSDVLSVSTHNNGGCENIGEGRKTMHCPYCGKIFRYNSEIDYCVWCGKRPADGETDYIPMAYKIEDLQLGIMQLLEENRSGLAYMHKHKFCIAYNLLEEALNLYMKEV